MHRACDRAGPQIVCGPTQSAHGPATASTQRHVVHLSSQDDSHSEKCFRRASKVCPRNIFKRSWYHHMLSGWAEVSYVSSQVAYVWRRECLNFNSFWIRLWLNDICTEYYELLELIICILLLYYHCHYYYYGLYTGIFPLMLSMSHI